MPTQTSKRQPLSCENCRKRKIKCDGKKNPCDTCVRRGYGHTCLYIRQAIPLATSSPRGLNAEALLQRLMRVESLLEQHIEDTSSQRVTPRESTTSASHDRLSMSSSSPFTEPNLQPAAFPPPKIRGTIITSPRGYQRFVPGVACSDAAAVNELLQSDSSFAMGSDFPFFAGSSCSRQSLLDTLPPTRQCEELKSVFFQVFSPLFHVLHDPTFHAHYAKFRQNPSDVSLSFLALIFVILSIAVTAFDEGHPLLADLGRESSAAANIRSLAGRYRSAAMRCLSADQFLWQHNLHTMQALVLLIYAINHAHGSSWALLGATLNIGFSIGLHVEPSHLDLAPVLSEERRRCWAALMLLYTIQNTCLGNIAPQKIIATVNLPADIDDEQLIEQGSNIIIQEGKADNAPTKMSYLLYKFKLYQIAAEVCVYAQGDADLNKVTTFNHRIDMEEEEHSVRFARHQDLPVYHLAHYIILKNYTNHLRLVLHRPYLQHQPSASNSAPMSSNTVVNSRRICRIAAMMILDNHKQLFEIDLFRPYRWYIYGIGSFHTFLAASTLVVLLVTSFNEDHPSDYSISLTALQDCLVRFESMAARSEICARAASILHRLLSNLTCSSSDSSFQQARPHPQQTGLTVSNNGFVALPSVTETTSVYDTTTSPVASNSPSLAFHNNSSFYGPCPPELQNLVQLPSEQWLGGPSAFSWADWNWEPTPAPSAMEFQGGISSHSHSQSFLRDTLIDV
ncbi:hypothetical protein LTR84_005658 [Exophiala bonariae]|uniref:Zn(2)-C6 fungal-type domain-containing protein n=1 Tax=Exophiala bonariae TaxID=1690606 RepID=A0AAV9N6G3_9EURO|nr:hypothetical protein LTR84_005658 [Exophiala bonariae]